MPKSASRDTLAADRLTLAALQNLPDYSPTNRAYNTTVLVELEREASAALDAVVSLQNALAEARGVAIQKVSRFHEGIQGARLSVKAQYGKNAFAVRSIGLKRQVDYKRPQRRATKLELVSEG